MIVLLVTLFSGFLLTYLLEEKMPPLVRLLMAAPLGIAVSGLVTLLIAHILGLTPFSLLLVSGILIGVPLFLLQDRWENIRTEWRKLRSPRWSVLLHFGVLLVFLGAFFRRVVYLASDGIGTGVWDNYADLAYHIAFIESFAKADNFPTMHPLYAGARLTYPYLVDFHIAMLEVAGMPLVSAFWWQNLLMMGSLAGLLMAFTIRATRSRIAGVFAPWLLFLNGGLGFLLLVPEAREQGKTLWQYVAQLPHDYSRSEPLLHWGASLPYWFGPMRGMALGAPLLVGVWWFWWTARGTADPLRLQTRLRAAGVLIGILTLSHTHTFLCASGMGVCLMLLGAANGPRWSRLWWWAWGQSFLIAISLAVPQLLVLFLGSETHTESFFGLSLGWMAQDAELNPLRFWMLNAGLFLPLLVLALFWKRGNRWMVRPALRWFYLPFLLCFLAPNIIKFAPWAWDSVKVLYVWYAASVVIVASLLARLWAAKVPGGKAVAALAIGLLTLSGALDVYRVASGSTSYIVFNNAARVFADRMNRVLPRHAVVVSAPVHNSPICLTGRTFYMTYPGYLWTNGLSYAGRDEEVNEIYKGGAAAEAILAKRKLRYVIVGPEEQTWATQQRIPLAKEYFARFPVIAEEGEYRLYDLASGQQGTTKQGATK